MARPTVFVVDDSSSVRTGIRRLLAPLRHPVRVFASAEQFIASTDTHSRGCLVMDVRLPGMSGLELQQRIAEQGWVLPIVFVTAQEDHATRDAALRRGAADYLPKPFPCDQLLADVRRAMAPDGPDPAGPPDESRPDSPKT
jgi:FixJ family two-component response regulator